MMKEKEHIHKAIEKAKESCEKGFFPAGALVVRNGKVISSEISAKYPNYKHSESRAVDKAFCKLGKSLDDCVLYCSLEPCLMCLTRAYWAGIRKIVYACSRRAVSQHYFEGLCNAQNIISDFNEEIVLQGMKEYENESLSVIREWENAN